MPAKKDRDDINHMASEPSPYGDVIARILMFLVGVAAFVMLMLDR